MSGYRAPPAGALLSVPLDALTAVYHRASGITHLLAAPAPELLAVLADGPLDADAVLARLAEDYDLADADRTALIARLDELADSGLIERV